MGASSARDKQPGRIWSRQRRPCLSAHSLENVPREAEATPGLQQLAWVFTIQLQVLNGADDLRVHISEHAARRWRKGGGGEEEQEEEGFRVRTHTQREEGKDKKTQKKHKSWA